MALEALGRLVGSWTTEATHPMVPGTIVRGTADFEWLEGKKFLIYRSSNEHPDFPDAIQIIGNTDRDRVGDGKPTSDRLEMSYFDSRGVFRVYEVTIDETAWRWTRMAPGFSQRFTGTFSDGGDTIVGVSQLCKDDVHWKDDLAITFRRRR